MFSFAVKNDVRNAQQLARTYIGSPRLRLAWLPAKAAFTALLVDL
jgi:hypothetical protein